MPLQGMSIAMSLSGIQYFVQTSLQPSIVSALQNLSVPDNTIKAGNIMGAGNSRQLAGEGWPPPTQVAWGVNTVVALSQGRMSSFNPTFAAITQGPNGEFTLKLTAKNAVVNYTWVETYDLQHCSSYAPPGPNSGCTDQGSRRHQYDYQMGIGTFEVAIVFKLQYAANAWQLSFVSGTPTTSDLSPNIPAGSLLNHQEISGCFSVHVSSSTQQALEDTNLAGPVRAALEPLFGSIPASGRLTRDLAFDFALGPSGLSFPGDAGLAAGVSGTTIWNETVYPGTNPPQLALPSIPTDHHLSYDVSDYSINGLFWGFFSAGLLKTTASAANSPDPAYFNTSIFQGSPLQALYLAYPNAPLTYELSALSAPQVNFQPIYELTAQAINGMKPPLPPNVATELSVLEGLVFTSEPEFFAQLVNTLGETLADRYKTVIEKAALATTALVKHSNQAIMNVIAHGDTIQVLKFDVTETDSLDGFKLGISGTTQTLQFGFTIVPGLTTATFVSSPIPGIGNNGGFAYIWNLALQPQFANVAKAIGERGVALPRIQGFNFLFEEATVTLENGYANVLTDVKHVNESGAVYFQSKRRIQHGEPIVSSAAARWDYRVQGPAPRRPQPLLPAEWACLRRSSS